MPFFKPLDVSKEPNYTNDTNAVVTPDKIATGKQMYRLAKLHNSWGTMDFARELTLANMDPLDAITRKVADYWATQEERRLIAAANGILADNISEDNGDMALNISIDTGAPTDANLISAEAVLDARQTAGDHQMMFSSIAMHSVVFNRLNKLNLIDYIPDSQGVVNFPSYLGMTVVVDDSLAPKTTGDNPVYTTVLFATGAFGYGVGRSLVPSELERVPAIGNGGGEDVLHTRRNPLIHPQGFQFTSAAVLDNTATLAELADPLNWDRVMDRKNCGLAFLMTNG
jgi:hypothetical protein